MSCNYNCFVQSVPAVIIHIWIRGKGDGVEESGKNEGARGTLRNGVKQRHQEIWVRGARSGRMEVGIW